MTVSVIKMIATWFYSGYLPKAPGTWGSLFTFPLVYMLYANGIDIFGFSFVTFWLFFIGWWAAEGYDIITDQHDNKQIVIDEVVGQMITLLPVYFFYQESLVAYLIGFVLFRFFDISKILGVSILDQKIPGGIGVMLDDVLAGAYGAVLIYLGGSLITIL